MSVKVFLDTNIILYLYFSDEVEKLRVIKDFLDSENFEFYISTQVINEFINVMSKKKKVDYENISNAVLELVKAFNISIVSISTIELALGLAKKNNYSFFDCLIVASAIESDCSFLYTEDMHNKHIIDNKLKIFNPFFNE